MGKTAKSTKKFASSGRLKKVIKARRSQQQQHRRKQGRKRDTQVHDEVESQDAPPKRAEKAKKMTVDDLLSGKFMEADVDDMSEDEVDLEGSDEEEEGASSDEMSQIADDESFASVDELEGK
ncbi:hypothetical protein M378DRAFT_10779 [Amanita muscaria Koide BX008]|uniref:Uncharacterized protein n=1 Tax=Amanita muscaria (strain Koide BX008) TaxID=946122 RepID=A0A0C2TEV2_AMAMK|nr:hypothetical protein M378DRAFT_10779 [Amanita muscaria Koide BX008]